MRGLSRTRKVGHPAVFGGERHLTPDLTPDGSASLPSAPASSGIAALAAPYSGHYQRIRYAVPALMSGPI
jgi:hypothetical protein